MRSVFRRREGRQRGESKLNPAAKTTSRKLQLATAVPEGRVPRCRFGVPDTLYVPVLFQSEWVPVPGRAGRKGWLSYRSYAHPRPAETLRESHRWKSRDRVCTPICRYPYWYGYSRVAHCPGRNHG